MDKNLSAPEQFNKRVFSKRLTELREAKGWSKTEFAKQYNKRFPPKRKSDDGGNEDDFRGILGSIKHDEDINYAGRPSLARVCDYCILLGCDIDYLTGRIDKKTHDAQFICEYTGLSESAVEFLHSYGDPPDKYNLYTNEEKERSKKVFRARFFPLLNRILKSGMIDILIKQFRQIEQCCNKINECDNPYYREYDDEGADHDLIDELTICEYQLTQSVLNLSNKLFNVRNIKNAASQSRNSRYEHLATRHERELTEMEIQQLRDLHDTALAHIKSKENAHE